MLVLSRKRHDVIRIADNITITVLGIVGNKVRLGIEAPSDVKILRLEVYERDARDRAKELKSA